MKRIVSLIVVIILVLTMGPTVFAAETTSATQITNDGAENTEKWSADKVKVSKTIAGTDIENVFDITLQVETQQAIGTMYQDPDVAICIVMDISNTMMEDYGSEKTKYDAAIESAEVFVDEFAEFTTGAQSKIGFVAFNTDGNSIAPMQRCDTTGRATTFKNTVRTKTGNIVNKYNGGSNYDETYHKNKRYTNIEAGLKMANDMLKACTNKNKYVIFLSDGLPTTYCKTTSQTDGNYVGYTPLSTSGTQNTNGVFRDRIRGLYVEYGGNYSDKGAIRARQMATTLKNNGVTVYTIGAGLNTFGGSDFSGRTTPKDNLSGEQMIQNQMERAFKVGVSTVDNNFNKITSYNSSTINNYHWEIGNFKGGTSGSYAALGSGKLFENWLRYAIGSNQYYDTSNTAQLKNQFAKIFSNLQKEVQEKAAKAWVVSDPMGMNLEFIGFYNKSGTLVSGDLLGSSGANKENTATKASGSRSFNWELQKSGYTSSTSSSTTTYTYTLKYRVRLTNEVTSGFGEGNSYNTNGTTTLTYQTLVNSSVSDMKSVNFPIPAVKGYLSELTFDKVDQFGRTVKGAVFTLVHDTTACKKCKGNDTSVAKNGYLADRTATSGADGKVTFTNIPSGHKYTLVETTAPAGYIIDATVYHVDVAYDIVTTNIVENKVTDPMDEYQIQLKKIDGTTQKETPLAGATFEVYSDAEMTTPAKHPDGTGIESVTTGQDGMAALGVLDINTTYYLKEIAAPAGYNMLNDAVIITVSPGATNKVTAITGTSMLVVEQQSGQSLIYVIKVTNNPGVILPATGGFGTLPYTLSGIVLMITTALMYVFRMRRRERRLKNGL